MLRSSCAGTTGIMLCLAALLSAGSAAGGQSAQDILDETGVRGGLVVHVHCGDGKLTAALRTGDLGAAPMTEVMRVLCPLGVA